MSPTQAVVLFIAAVLGGTLNAVAGGGSFFSFPALLLTGVPAISANATSTVALWPGSVASALAYRAALKVERAVLLVLVAASLVGGVVGAVVLVRTPQDLFLRLTPFLLLLATLLFATGGAVTNWVRAHLGHHVKQQSGAPTADEDQEVRDSPPPSWRLLAGMGVAQLVLAAYGGFFGGGLGILVLSMLAALGMRNIHTMNALKVILQAAINGVAAVTFIVLGAVAWPEAVLMVVGAIMGGYGGASVARRLDPRAVRWFVILVGCIVTVYLFYEYR